MAVSVVTVGRSADHSPRGTPFEIPTAMRMLRQGRSSLAASGYGSAALTAEALEPRQNHQSVSQRFQIRHCRLVWLAERGADERDRFS